MTTSSPSPLSFDVLIVGSGLAGLSAALLLSQQYRVAILTKRAVREGSSGWAQGGIAAVWDKDDSFAAHVDDTLVAGAGLCDLAATQFVVEQAPQAIAWLQQLGVPFSQEDGHLHLTREGDHSARRIVHVTDATGAAVQQTLIEKVKASPNITLFEHHTLVDLITTAKLGQDGPNRCVGLYALDDDTDEVLTFQAPHTILATGGAGKVYLYTTNPDTATGDGIAAAWRAGCAVQNMEFIQFHPTCLYHPHAKSFLISEAVRGEGGRLLLPDGTRFMPAHDPRAELAPRGAAGRGSPPGRSGGQRGPGRDRIGQRRRGHDLAAREAHGQGRVAAFAAHRPHVRPLSQGAVPDRGEGRALERAARPLGRPARLRQDGR